MQFPFGIYHCMKAMNPQLILRSFSAIVNSLPYPPLGSLWASAINIASGRFLLACKREGHHAVTARGVLVQPVGARVAQRQRLLHVLHGRVGSQAWGLVEPLYLKGVTGIFSNLR